MYYGEKFNAVTHLVGAVLALAGAIVLVVLAAAGGDAWKVVGVAIYGVTLVLLFSVSATYHSLRGRAKNILRELDHHSIYLLIAGSYAPFCLVTLRGPWGWSRLRDIQASGMQRPFPTNPRIHHLQSCGAKVIVSDT